ncbi:MAG: hypothetical protein K6D37_12545 [Prevotella sp.]|nr:hypothetical protein [Prevotella sp.]
MKKLLLSMFAMVLTATTAFADFGWYDSSMNIGGVSTDPFGWSGNPNSPTDLGTVYDMTVTSIAFKIWDDSNDRGGANMYFAIYDENGTKVGSDVDIHLGSATRISGDHDFSISWNTGQDLAATVGLTLEAGKTYFIDAWAKTYGSAGDHWYSNNGGNYHAKLTIINTSRTVTLGNYGTICLPFNGTISNATLYKIDSKIVVGGVLKGINISSVGTSLTAGQAYIFKSSSSNISVSSLSGDYTEAITGGAIVGNYSSSAAVATGMYIIKDNKLWDAGTGVTIGQYKAYIDLTNVTEVASARGANSIYFGDDATGIESIQNENSENVMFNLQGQRVNNAQKGLVIVGGKKMLRK